MTRQWSLFEREVQAKVKFRSELVKTYKMVHQIYRLALLATPFLLAGSICGYAGEVQVKSLKCAGGAYYPVQLSFDDGPQIPATVKVLDILRAHGIKAQFFISGSNFPNLAKGRQPTDKEKKLIEVIKRMKAEGHSIGSHSFAHIEHANVKTQSQQAVAANLEANRKVLDALGITGTIPFRFPYGDGWFGETNAADEAQADRVMTRIKASDFVPVHWDIDTWDWSKIKRKALPGSMLKQICSHSGGIVLMHDIHAWTADNLDALIRSIVKSGHKIVTPEEMKKHQNFVSFADSAAGLFTCNRPVGDLDQVWRNCDEYRKRSSDLNDVEAGR